MERKCGAEKYNRRKKVIRVYAGDQLPLFNRRE